MLSLSFPLMFKIKKKISFCESIYLLPNPENVARVKNKLQLNDTSDNELGHL